MIEAYLEDNRPTIDEVCESYDECTEECPAYEFCHSKTEREVSRMGYQSLVMSKEERDTILQTINEAFLKKGMKYTVSAEDYEVRGGDFWIIIQKER